MKKKIFAAIMSLALVVTLTSTACVDTTAATYKIMVDGVVYEVEKPANEAESNQPSVGTQAGQAVSTAVEAGVAEAEATKKAEEEAAKAAEAEIAPPYYVEVDCTNCVVRVWCNKNAETGKWETLVREMVCSTGRPGHATPRGTYKIYEHTDGGGAHLMVDGTYGRYCMRWKQGGYMFHSVCYSSAKAAEPIAQEVADLGTNVSRGCIRLSVADAQWMYNNMSNGTVVYIY